MIETLLGQIKGVLGKSFLFAGLLPSSVLLFCWYWLRGGSPGVEAALRRVVVKPEEAAPEAILTALLLLALGLIFYASRGWILNLLQSLPGFPLLIFRKRGLARQRRLLREVKRQKTSLIWQLTAFLWAEAHFEPFMATPPEDVKTPSPAQVAKESERARGILTKYLSAEDDADEINLTEGEEEKVASALLKLYTLVMRNLASPPDVNSSPPNSGDMEVEAWRALLGSFPEAVEVLSRIKINVRVRWAGAYVRAQSQFPQSEQWLEPTVLGNRIAALDDYAQHRYRIAMGTLWTRLWGVLPKEEKQAVTDARLSMEVLTNLCVGFFALGLLALGLTLIETIPILYWHCRFSFDWHDVPCPLHLACSDSVVLSRRAVILIPLAFLLSRVFYDGAVYAFGTLAEQMARAADLYRLHLVKALGYKTPGTVGEELDILGELSEFFAQAVPRDKNRQIEPPEKPKAKQRADAAVENSDDSPPA
jgi:hypothetical protein